MSSVEELLEEIAPQRSRRLGGCSNARPPLHAPPGVEETATSPPVGVVLACWQEQQGVT
jgi:hypothetical protein